MLFFKKIKKNILLLFLFACIAFLLYFPMLNNVFLSDDYDSLYRICIDKSIFIKDLRPMIDISFYMNYLLSGMNSRGYYIFNLLIHILNVFLIYRFAFSYKIFQEKDQHLFAFLCALLFLFYPFHNEGIAWLSGRLSSISCFFALLALITMTSNLRFGFKIILVFFLYFVGLSAYESILLLPFLGLIIYWKKSESWKKYMSLAFFCTASMGLYLLLRFYISGVIYGGYGQRMIDQEKGGSFVLKGVKTLGRTILPPSENTTMLALFFILAIIIAVILHWMFIKKYKSQSDFLFSYFKIVIVFFLAMLIPMLFGISTRTSEGDRLLYFPSVFLSMILAFFILFLVKTTNGKIIACSVVSLYFIVCLRLNNQNWEMASQVSAKILQNAGGADRKNVIFLNLPDEIEGAFVFRNGFHKAMILNKFDTGRIWVNNYLTRLEYLEFKNEIQPVEKTDSLFLPPVSRITFLPNDSVRVENIFNNNKLVLYKKNTAIFYWNKFALLRLF